MCVVIDWPILATELFGSVAERYARKIVKLLHGDCFDIDIAQSKWKGVTACSWLVRESLSQLLENERILKKGMRI